MSSPPSPPSASWPQRLLASSTPYRVHEPLAARFRHRQLHAVLRITPLAMVANMLNVGIVLTAFWGSAHRVWVMVWALLVAVAAAQGLTGWARARRRRSSGGSGTASQRALDRLSWHAAVLALLWAPMPVLLFPAAAPDEQILVATITTGMMCAGAFALATVPLAGTVYAAILGLAAMLALLLSSLPLAPAIAALLLIYMGVVVAVVWSTARLFGARMVAEAEAERQNEVVGLLLRDFEENASDLLWETGVDGRLRAPSQRLLQLLDLVPQTALARPLVEVLAALAEGGEEALGAHAELQRLLAGGVPFRELALPLQRGGQTRWLAVSAKPLLDEAGRPLGWRGVLADVTDTHVAHRQLRWLAHNDTLTGLRNRHQFRSELQRHLKAPEQAQAALLCLDLDHFKNINDTFGHGTGDLLLKEVGQRLLAQVRRSDTVARMGGDEFAVLLRGQADSSEIEAFARRLVEVIGAPCRVGGAQVQVGCSVGIALIPRDGLDVDLVLNHADQALYAAKDAGRHGVCVFAPEMAASARRRLQVEQALRQALPAGALTLAYQPQVALDSRRVLGFEALLRWRDEELGDVSPGEFVPVAEDCGLMPELGRWVLEQACRDAATWPGGLVVSINVSPVQVMGCDVAAQALAAAQQAGIEPARVEIEITESAFLHEGGGTAEAIMALHAAGFRLALDDFGTGYSALGYLRRYPFHTLKIDRSFVRDLLSRGDARAIVKMILGLSRTLRLQAVAEGVEEPAQAALLAHLGCQSLQGYLASRPMPAAAVQGFLQQWATTAPPEWLDTGTAEAFSDVSRW
jgi:diguanylate cyclase (GGDEF)-like protein